MVPVGLNGRMERLEGRSAIVTGAASGIGRAVAEAFADAGMRLTITDVNEDNLRQLATQLGDAGVEVEAVVADVRDPDAVDRVGRAAMERFGQLHVAVNNAGIVNGGYSWELSLDEWHRVLDTNLWGVIHGVRSFVPLILESGQGGHVVNTASMAAVLPVNRIAPYTVAKHGVLGLSDVLRLELADASPPIGVSVLLPGMIRTGMNPIGTTEPSQVAANVVDAIRAGRDYVFTDNDATEGVEARLSAILAARGDVLS
jgi:NAD(P)-dependent dehydrogenase (short-subunit alcohol dehydrogenase family)